MIQFNKAKLDEIGFRDIAQWEIVDGRLSYKLFEPGSEADALCAFPNALYAFTSGENVLYVGKTTRSIQKRFVEYCNPGKSQVTNRKCNSEIMDMLKRGSSVEISIFTGNRFLRYDIFEINLAAGLEDSLIKTIRPRWNGKFIPGDFITETQELETEAAVPNEGSIDAQSTSSFGKTFQIKLGKTYYLGGFINTGKAIDDKIGGQDEPMLIRLGNASHPGVEARIDRKANSNGTPRIYGGARIANWFQENFRLNDVVTGIVLTPNQILLLGKALNPSN